VDSRANRNRLFVVASPILCSEFAVNFPHNYLSGPLVACAYTKISRRRAGVSGALLLVGILCDGGIWFFDQPAIINAILFGHMTGCLKMTLAQVEGKPGSRNPATDLRVRQAHARAALQYRQ